jgi:hypothetical protein
MCEFSLKDIKICLCRFRNHGKRYVASGQENGAAVIGARQAVFPRDEQDV